MLSGEKHTPHTPRATGFVHVRSKAAELNIYTTSTVRDGFIKAHK